MSFRELRDFSESVRALGYPRLISIENFRVPNFELVADLLFWLVQRYDPHIEISEDISTEQARVKFLQQCAEALQATARIRLNIKQLYKADGFAVKELLKLSSVLYQAIQNTNKGNENIKESGVNSSLSSSSLNSRLEELRSARHLSGEIVESGSRLFSGLGQEENVRPARDRAIAFLDSLASSLDGNFGSEAIEREIRGRIVKFNEESEKIANEIRSLREEEKNLKQKIERKQIDLERAEKRLKSLKSVKPAFQEEYLALERELRNLHEIYLERFRNLQYLQSELDRINAEELEKKAENEKVLAKMQKRLRDEELKILRGEALVDENQIDQGIFDSDQENPQSDESEEEDEEEESQLSDRGQPARNRPAAASGQRIPPNGSSSVRGRPTGGKSPQPEESEEASSDPESSDQVDDDEPF
jgi:clusterin-associated protein 1